MAPITRSFARRQVAINGAFRKSPSSDAAPRPSPTSPEESTAKVPKTASSTSKRRIARDDTRGNELRQLKHGKVTVPSRKRDRHEAPDQEPIAKKKKSSVKFLNPVPDSLLVLYMCGDGSEGELGLGRFFLDLESHRKPFDVRPPHQNPHLNTVDSPIVHFATGYQHMLALTRDNRILSWGCNKHGALGRDTTWDRFNDPFLTIPPEKYLNPIASIPEQVDLSFMGAIPTWSKLAAGRYFSCALTTDGKVYAWGAFEREGAVQEGDKQLIGARPALIPGLENIVQLAAGHNHLVAADKDHKIYTWGNGENGQLGRANAADETGAASALQPKEVDALDATFSGVKKLACGANHSFVLDCKGRLYGWGANVFGQVDPEDQNDVVEKPQLLYSLRELRFVDVAAGNGHSLACQENGAVITWGDMRETGPGRVREILTLGSMPKVVTVAAGHHHDIAITETGKQVYTWGKNAGFATGHDSLDNINIPTLLRDDSDEYSIESTTKWCAVGGGYRYSVFACDSLAEPDLNTQPLSELGLGDVDTDHEDTSGSVSCLGIATPYRSEGGEGEGETVPVRRARTSRKRAPNPEQPNGTGSTLTSFGTSPQGIQTAQKISQSAVTTTRVPSGSAQSNSFSMMASSIGPLPERDFRLPYPIAVQREQLAARAGAAPRRSSRKLAQSVRNREREMDVAEGVEALAQVADLGLARSSSVAQQQQSAENSISEERDIQRTTAGEPTSREPTYSATAPRRSRRKPVPRKKI